LPAGGGRQRPAVRRRQAPGGAHRDAREYPGVSVRLTAFLGEVRIPVQIDIGFSDVFTPAAVEARADKSFDMSNAVEQVLSKGRD